MDESLQHKIDCVLPTNAGDFQMHLFEEGQEGQPEAVKQHLALIMGDVRNKTGVLTRIHSECYTGDVFGCQRCDCQDQLVAAMDMIRRETEGVLLYLRQEGRGIGLENKLKAYKLQDQGLDTVEANQELGFDADARDYRVAAEMLKFFDIKSVRLMSNNANKVSGLVENGIGVEKRVPLVVHSPIRDRAPLFQVKQKKLGHVFDELNDVLVTPMAQGKYPLLAPHLFHADVPMSVTAEEHAGQMRLALEQMGPTLKALLMQGPAMRGDALPQEDHFDYILLLESVDQSVIEQIASVKKAQPRSNFLYVSDHEYRTYPRDRRLQFFLTKKVHGEYDFGNPPTRKDILDTAINYAVQIKDTMRPLLFDFLEGKGDKQRLSAKAHTCLKRMDDCFLRVLCMYSTGKYPLHRSHLLQYDTAESTASIMRILETWHSTPLTVREVCEALYLSDEILNGFLRSVAERKL